MKLIAYTLSAVLLAAPIASMAQTTEKANTEADADKSQNRVICKRQSDTGSRLGSKRVCMTAAQWGQLEHDQREAVEKIQAGRTKSG